MFSRYTILYAFIILLGVPAFGFAQGAKLIEQFESKDWSAQIYEDNGKKICFAASKPTSSEPSGVRRGEIIFYVSSWPADKVNHEVSVKIGYSFKPGSEVTAEIGDKKFTFFVKDDKAFIAEAEEEKRLIEAIKAGSAMVIKGLSSRGTQTTDQYSLSGVSAALKKIAQSCV
ncbi:MAG: invasion associated locus B family protein [Pseudomonadota bacterium]